MVVNGVVGFGSRSSTDVAPYGLGAHGEVLSDKIANHGPADAVLGEREDDSEPLDLI